MSSNQKNDGDSPWMSQDLSQRLKSFHDAEIKVALSQQKFDNHEISEEEHGNALSERENAWTHVRYGYTRQMYKNLERFGKSPESK